MHWTALPLLAGSALIWTGQGGNALRALFFHPVLMPALMFGGLALQLWLVRRQI